MELSAVKKIKNPKKRRKKKIRKKELHKAQITWYVGYWPGMQMAQIQALQSRDLYLSVSNIPSEATAINQSWSFTLIFWLKKIILRSILVLSWCRKKSFFRNLRKGCGVRKKQVPSLPVFDYSLLASLFDLRFPIKIPVPANTPTEKVSKH